MYCIVAAKGNGHAIIAETWPDKVNYIGETIAWQ